LDVHYRHGTASNLGGEALARLLGWRRSGPRFVRNSSTPIAILRSAVQAGSRPSPSYRRAIDSGTAGDLVEPVDARATAWLASTAYDPVYGARPVIQRELQNPRTQQILDGRIPDGATVHVGASDKALASAT
jgi:hypothetical protein